MIASRPDAYHDWLAWVYAWPGLKKDTIRESERAFEEGAVDRYLGPGDEEALAQVLVKTGELDRALELFDRLLDQHYANAVTVPCSDSTPISMRCVNTPASRRCSPSTSSGWLFQ